MMTYIIFTWIVGLGIALSNFGKDATDEWGKSLGIAVSIMTILFMPFILPLYIGTRIGNEESE